jgi:hypothetical protein
MTRICPVRIQLSDAPAKETFLHSRKKSHRHEEQIRVIRVIRVIRQFQLSRPQRDHLDFERPHDL